jgi:hypothetical protein
MKLLMSKQEARKVTIIEELLAGRFTNNQAAELLSLSVRQVQRMEANTSELPFICRKELRCHQNQGISVPWDKACTTTAPASDSAG